MFLLFCEFWQIESFTECVHFTWVIKLVGVKAIPSAPFYYDSNGSRIWRERLLFLIRVIGVHFLSALLEAYQFYWSCQRTSIYFHCFPTSNPFDFCSNSFLFFCYLELIWTFSFFFNFLRWKLRRLVLNLSFSFLIYALSTIKLALSMVNTFLNISVHNCSAYLQSSGD